MKALLVALALVGLASGNERCEVFIRGQCFWTEVHVISDISYARAEAICSRRDSVPAVIPDEEAYNRILTQIRRKIPPGKTWTVAWTGMRINPLTGMVNPEDAYWRWFPIPGASSFKIPWTGGRVRDYTHTYLEVKRLTGSKYQGLVNGEPATRKRGVVCQMNL